MKKEEKAGKIAYDFQFMKKHNNIVFLSFSNFFFLIYSKGCKTLLRISLLLVKLPLSVSLDVIFLVSQSHKRKVS